MSKLNLHKALEKAAQKQQKGPKTTTTVVKEDTAVATIRTNVGSSSIDYTTKMEVVKKPSATVVKLNSLP